MKKVRFAILSILLVTLTGCAFLPGAGPAGISIPVGGDDGSLSSYAVVDLNPQVVSALKARPDPSLTSLAEYQPASVPVIGIGDTIRVTVWEAAPGNLFTTVATSVANIGSAGGTTIPDQVVPKTGTINVPFAGDIKVVGKSARDAERSIQAQLRPKAVDPQVLVNVVRSEDNSVTVAGDAVVGGQMQLGRTMSAFWKPLPLPGASKLQSTTPSFL